MAFFEAASPKAIQLIQAADAAKAAGEAAKTAAEASKEAATAALSVVKEAQAAQKSAAQVAGDLKTTGANK